MPSKFQIHVDESIRNPTTTSSEFQQPQQQHHETQVIEVADEDKPARYIPEGLDPKRRYFFDERKLYPFTGEEYCFEELNLRIWQRKRDELIIKSRLIELQRENDELRDKCAEQEYQISLLVKQLQVQENQSTTQTVDIYPPTQTIQPPQHQLPPQQQQQKQPQSSNRLSLLPQSLQPTNQGMELYSGNDLPTVIHSWDTSVIPDITKNTMATSDFENRFANDKFTVPVNSSQFIRENIPTSTPASKKDDEKRKSMFGNNRRMSRPSMGGGGSPTMVLSPIKETSRECNSKSSSSSSTSCTTPGTITKQPAPTAMEVDAIEPDRPLDPNDPTTYRRLLRSLIEPIEKRLGYMRLNRMAPKIRQGACFQVGQDNYLVDKELSRENKTYIAQLLTDDSNDDSDDCPIKNVCFRFDQPANDWLYYICNELNRRLVRQKSKPDIELSVSIANPAIIYNDASILVDEYFRFVTMQDFIEACIASGKSFPKSVAAYITLELVHLARQMHNCDIVHMNINTKNILVTCCPTRDDIANVDERLSIVKLIGFDRALDTKLLPADFKFNCRLDEMITCQMLDSQPWLHEVDWFGILNCVHRMFFLEDMAINKDDNGRWTVGKTFKGFPTEVWAKFFDTLLNMNDVENVDTFIVQTIDELNTWVKANINFVLKEADALDRILEEHCKAINKSVRV